MDLLAFATVGKTKLAIQHPVMIGCSDTPSS
jgi:hypothetical protein